MYVQSLYKVPISQKSTYVQKPKVALKELRNIACDRKKWSSLPKAVC